MRVLISFALTIYLKNIWLKLTLWITSKYLTFTTRGFVLTDHISDIVYSVSHMKWTNKLYLRYFGRNSSELVMLGFLSTQIETIVQRELLKQISKVSQVIHIQLSLLFSTGYKGIPKWLTWMLMSKLWKFEAIWEQFHSWWVKISIIALVMECYEIILPETLLFLRSKHNGNVVWRLTEEQLFCDGWKASIQKDRIQVRIQTFLTSNKPCEVSFPKRKKSLADLSHKIFVMINRTDWGTCLI